MSTPTVGRPGAMPRTAWRDRVRVLESAAGVTLDGLGELVEAELTRVEGVLFTATPAEELDEISRWARLSDAAWCGQVRAIGAAHNRMPAAQREFLPCEVALALNLSDTAAQDMVATGLLTASIPGLLEAVEVGMLTVRHAYAVLGALSGTGLSAEEQHAVVTIALARYTDQTPVQLGKLVSKLVLLVNSAAAQAREADRTAHRQVRFRAVEDGQGLLTARGPLAQIEAVRAALAAKLGPADPDQPSNQDAREFDLLVELLTTGESGGPGGQWTAAIVIPHHIATGGQDELAEIPGLGPVLPDTARDILATCATVSRIVIDEHGQVLEVSGPLPGPAAAATDSDPRRWLHDLTHRPLTGMPAGSAAYRPTERLRRFVMARDRICTFPGCTRPATRTDLDHRLPHPLGPTNAENLGCLCRRHHRAKQALFTVIRLPDGTLRWITRGGWYFDRPPQGY